jgi:hypothetical protein
VHTFSKVCISLQSVQLAEKLHTFLTFYRLSCTLFADFFGRFAHVLHTLNDVKSTFMHTLCRLSFFLIPAVQTLMSLHAYQFCALQTFCRPRADSKQSKCVSLLCSSATGGGPSPLSVVAAAALEGEAAAAAAAAFEGEAAPALAPAGGAAAPAAAGRRRPPPF